MNTHFHELMSVMAMIDGGTETNIDVMSDTSGDDHILDVQPNKRALEQTDLRRKIEDILEAKRLRAEFDF